MSKIITINAALTSFSTNQIFKGYLKGCIFRFTFSIKIDIVDICLTVKTQN
jgi:hypothetical protein